MLSVRSLYVSILVILLSFSSSAEEAKKEAAQNPTVLRWLVVHAPNDYFIKMANFFKEKVERETDNRVVVKILDEAGCFEDLYPALKERKSLGKEGFRSDIIERLSSLEISEKDRATLEKYIKHAKSAGSSVELKRAELLHLLEAGKIDIAQNYTHYLAKVANPEYHALELPYLFASYDHVNQALESEAGEQLLNSTALTKGYRGLAYTFSGGLMVTLSHADKPYTSLASWKNRTYRPQASVIRSKTLKRLGGKILSAGEYISSAPDQVAIHRPTNLLLENVISGEEINLPDVERWLSDFLPNEKRTAQKKNQYDLNKFAVTETQHALLSTVMLIREAAYQSMSEKDRKIVKAAALAAGRFERGLTVDRYEAAKKRLVDSGFAWKTITPEVRSEVRTAAQPVYNWLYNKFPTTKNIVLEMNKFSTPNSKYASK